MSVLKKLLNMLPIQARSISREQEAAQEKKFSNATFSTVYLNSSGQVIWDDGDYTRFAEQGYMRNVIANYAANMVAKAVSTVPILLIRYDAAGVKQNVRAHPVLDIMQRPNPLMSGVDFIEQILLHQMIGGSAYILKVKDKRGAIRELHALRPDRVTVIVEEGSIKSYRYTLAGDTREYAMNSDTGACDVLQIKNFHPIDDVYGLSAFSAASYSIGQHNQASLWNQSLLRNSARPSGALIVKGEDNNLTEEQYNKLKAQMDEFFSGCQNPGRPLLLEGGLEWKEMGISPKDMDFVNAKQSMARDIVLPFGVPSYLLGIPGDNTYSNLAEARFMFYENTVLPMAYRLYGQLSNWFAYDFPKENLRLEPNKEGISVFVEQREQILGKLNDVGFLTVNEKRALVGFAPINGGEVLDNK